jgi:hypothetical protein
MNRFFLGLTLLLVIYCSPARAWGPQGHRLVALIARSQLSDGVIETVNYYLKGMSWEDAACWMDDMQDNSKYDYMKPWHYIHIEKDKTYVQTKDQNIVNKLEYYLRMLQYRSLQSEDMINETLRMIFHLIADVHQPLHCGYAEDNGGTNVRLYLVQKETNLHKMWDSEIIHEKKMDIWYCAKALVGMKLSVKNRAEIEKTDVIKWMNESRTLLPDVYKISGGKIDQKYIDANAPIVETQLIKAGLRLAAILNQYFK